MLLINPTVIGCLDQTLPVSEWLSDGLIEEMQVTATGHKRTLVVLARNSVITCQSQISQWSLRWHHQAATSDCASVKLIFVVYRQSSECGPLMYVGSNKFHISDTGPELREMEAEFHVHPRDRIDVVEGDFISVHVMLNSRCRVTESSVWVAGRRVVGAEMYHKVLFGAVYLDGMVPCFHLERSNNTFPFLSAVVGE